MRMIFLLTLAGIGCAVAQPKPLAKADLNQCEYLGEQVYNPHNAILDTTNTLGPSEVHYYHQEAKTYRVVGGKLYSCPVG